MALIWTLARTLTLNQALGLAVVGCDKRCNPRRKGPLGALAIDRVNVTEGQTYVDDKRKQREP